MINDRLSEISSYLQHQDHSLAVRRLLDVSFDIHDPMLIREAILLSRYYHQTVKTSEPETRDNFLAKANELLRIMSSEKLTDHAAESLIEANQISKKYSKGNFTLSPISLQVSTGDILGVVGENGNGKTTLLRCLAGQLAIDSGTIHHFKLKESDYYGIKHQVAFIPQRIPRWYGLLKDNLHFSAAIAEVRGKENSLMVDFILERLGLGAYSNFTWNQISSGYRTRFEIARVLLQKPSLLILDEPLANLDINAQQTILTDLKFLAKSINHTMGIVLSSQQLHEVEKIADNVLFLKQGSCVYQTRQKNKTATSYVLELETTASRDEILNILGADINVQFNGGFYTVSSTVYTVKDMVARLVSGELSITYFRDITYSTKRLFN
jgi:ABC-2 type transport system ATP-binding protein